MNFSQNIIDMNNKAVGCLLQGNGEGAVQTLGSALSSLQLYQEFETTAKAHLQRTSITSYCVAPQHEQHLREPQDQGQQQQEGTPTASLPEHLLHSMAAGGNQSNCSAMSSIPLSRDGMADNSSGTFSVFNQAMTICKIDQDKMEEDGHDGYTISHNYHRLLSMLLYNLGLSLHLQAVQTGKAAELKGAMDLYEMSFSVIETEWQHFVVEDLMLLLMALFNNLGHIHSNMYNVAQRETCVAWLKALAGHPTFHKLMQRKEYAPFFMNLLVVVKQEQLISPAA